MNIQEAVKKALESDKCIYRKSEKVKGIDIFIKPTRSKWECCLLILPNKKESSFRWNPTTEDLIATDWELI